MSTSATHRRPWLRRAFPALLIVGAFGFVGTAQSALAGRHVSASLASRYGGSLSIRTIGPDDCLNDQLSTTNVANQIDVALMDPLITLDQQGKPSPDLATGWRITNGGNVITFFLRHGVRFSNGDPFTAASVKWNFDYVLNPKTKSPNPGLLGPLKTIRVLGPYTIQLVLKAPYRPLFTSLAGYYLGMVDPKTTAKLGSNQCGTVVGTGPFKIQSVGPGFNPVTLVRNPYHTWASPWQYNHHQAYLDKLTFKPILSDATAISELLTGGVDVSEIAPSQLGRVQHDPNILIRRYRDEGLDYLLFNTNHAPLNDANVRLGIAEAIDRKALVKAALNGLGTPAYSQVPARLPDYDTQSAKYAPQYNPADAQRLLKAHPVTGTLSLITFNDPTSTLTGELIQSELAQVGVKVSVQPHSVQDAISLQYKGSGDMFLDGYTYDDPDILYLDFAPGEPGIFYTNPTLTRYLTGGRESTNPRVVRNDYIQAQRFLNRLTLTDPLFIALDMFGINKRVHGWHVNFFTLGYTVEPVVQDLWVSK